MWARYINVFLLLPVLLPSASAAAVPPTNDVFSKRENFGTACGGCNKCTFDQTFLDDCSNAINNYNSINRADVTYMHQTRFTGPARLCYAEWSCNTKNGSYPPTGGHDIWVEFQYGLAWQGGCRDNCGALWSIRGTSNCTARVQAVGC